MMYTSLFTYRIADKPHLPPLRAALEYILAGNGVFARGARHELTVLLPVAPCMVKGLDVVAPHVQLAHPRVPADLVTLMWSHSLLAMDVEQRPVEVVFHLHWDTGQWQMEIPSQTQGHAHAQPVGPAIGSSYERALVEVHSHHAMPAFFSDDDNADETGFRIFAVLGCVFTQPQLRVRVGLYGHTWQIPASWIFELPPNVTECLAC